MPCRRFFLSFCNFITCSSYKYNQSRNCNALTLYNAGAAAKSTAVLKSVFQICPCTKMRVIKYVPYGTPLAYKSQNAVVLMAIVQIAKMSTLASPSLTNSHFLPLSGIACTVKPVIRAAIPIAMPIHGIYAYPDE